MCVRVYVCVCVSLPARDKSLSDPVQDPQCPSLLQPAEDKLIHKWCADNGWTRKWIYLTLLQRREQPEWSTPGVAQRNGRLGISQKKKKKKKAGGWPRVSIEKGPGTLRCTHRNPKHSNIRPRSWWVIFSGFRSDSTVTPGLRYVIRFTVIWTTCGRWRSPENYTTLWNTRSDARQTIVTAPQFSVANSLHLNSGALYLRLQQHTSVPACFSLIAHLL